MASLRHFTVRFDRVLRMMQITASDASTREWCVLHDVDVMLEKVVRPFLDTRVAADPPPGERARDVTTPSLMAAVIEQRLRDRFPDDAIEVRAAP